MGKYDQAMKLIVAANPLAISEFILRYAGVEIPIEGMTVVAMLNTEFEGYEVEADGLLLLRTSDGEEILLHIEFQRARDTTMPDRQLEYCLRARKKHGSLPIISCVIYLRPDGTMPEPPLCWQLRNGRQLLLFDYICIKLWELPREELLALNQPALLPLILLTQGEVNRMLVREMFQRLLDNRRQDLFLVGEILAALVLKSEDLEWLKREVAMLKDIIKESPAYHWITEEAREEGIAQGREEAREEARQREQEVRQREQEARQREQEARQREQESRQEAQKIYQQALEGFRQIAVTLVTERFPELARLVKKQVYQVEDQGRLQRMILQANSIQNIAEMTTLLLDLDGDE